MSAGVRVGLQEKRMGGPDGEEGRVQSSTRQAYARSRCREMGKGRDTCAGSVDSSLPFGLCHLHAYHEFRFSPKNMDFLDLSAELCTNLIKLLLQRFSLAILPFK